MNKLALISLGCAKNTVDGELMLGKLAEDFILTDDPFDSDVIIINTCGFIESAKEESIQTILEVAKLKESGRLKALVVTGCLSERYKEELADGFPEVDGFLGLDAWHSIGDVVRESLAGKKVRKFERTEQQADFTKRILATSPPTAYVRISDGCSNRCTFCAIPLIRGKLRSRTMEDIENEVIHLVQQGADEFVLIAQDTTKYGEDIYEKPMLNELLERLASIDGVSWLRLLYCYPENITPELLDIMVKHDNIVKYIDIPIQHFDDGVLKAMNRKNTLESTYKVVNMIRDASSEFIVRTTLIAGFPGESEEAFETMLKAVEELEFDRLGCFAYSREEGTGAAKMQGQIDEEVKQQRAERIMLLQQKISKRRAQMRIGCEYKVLVEGMEDDDIYFGRSYAEAPDVDGKVYFRSEVQPVQGEYVRVKITGADEYDVFGEAVN